jgi:hypothetical protein
MKFLSGVIAVVIMLVPPLIAAQTVMTNFTGASIATGPPSDWGTIRCAGGEVLEWPPSTQPPCSDTTRRLLGRGLVQGYMMVTTDPRMIGRESVMSNINADGWTPFGPGSGHIWGTVAIYVSDGGVETGEVWDGIWRGTRTVTETSAASVMRAEVHGSGGRIEGLSAHYDIVIDFVTGSVELSGVIIEPGSRQRVRRPQK